MRKLIALLLALTFIFALAACEKEAESSEPLPVPSSSEPAEPIPAKKVGVAMPTGSLKRWAQSGSEIKAQLEAAGYEVDLQFGTDDGDPEIQLNQIEAMLSGDCEVLVIAPVYPQVVLNGVLAKAKAKGVSVIAYDRMILNSDALSYYVGFDSQAAGSLQGEFIADALDLENAEGPFNIELFSGYPFDSSNGVPCLFHRGLRKELQPYFDSGKLVVPSEEITSEEISIEEDWAGGLAMQRMEELIESQGYGPEGKKLDVVWCSTDASAIGVSDMMEYIGYTAGEKFPIITGSGCEIYNMKNIANGMQSMSLFLDRGELVSRTVTMVISILKGEKPEVNNTVDYDNGLGTKIPAYLCAPVVCTKENYRELLIDSGYYTENELYEQFSTQITPNPFKPTTE